MPSTNIIGVLVSIVVSAQSMSIGHHNQWVLLAITKGSPATFRRYNLYTYEGSDEPYVAATGRPQYNLFEENQVSGGDETIKLQDADGVVFRNNDFAEATTARFDGSTETLVVGNTGLDDAELKVENGACFAAGSDAAYEPVC